MREGLIDAVPSLLVPDDGLLAEEWKLHHSSSLRVLAAKTLGEVVEREDADDDELHSYEATQSPESRKSTRLSGPVPANTSDGRGV